MSANFIHAARGRSAPAPGAVVETPDASLREHLDRVFPPLRLYGIEAVGQVVESTYHQVWPPGALGRVAAAAPSVKPPRRSSTGG